MTAGLIGDTWQLVYDPRASAYRRPDGRFASRAEVLRQVETEETRLKTRLQGHARLMTQGAIDLAEFQTRMANDLKLSHIRMGALAAGGEDGLTFSHFGRLGRGLREEYQFLRGFGEALTSGALTPTQAIARAGMYARSTTQAFYRSENTTRVQEGYNLARRDLDPMARHCVSCPAHATNGWVPINEITPPGVGCECRGRCRCRISYKR